MVKQLFGCMNYWNIKKIKNYILSLVLDLSKSTNLLINFKVLSWKPFKMLSHQIIFLDSQTDKNKHFDVSLSLKCHWTIIQSLLFEKLSQSVKFGFFNCVKRESVLYWYSIYIVSRKIKYIQWIYSLHNTVHIV